MTYFDKRGIEIEAFQWLVSDETLPPLWFDKAVDKGIIHISPPLKPNETPILRIRLRHTTLKAVPGDWIVKNGNVISCFTPANFRSTFKNRQGDTDALLSARKTRKQKSKRNTSPNGNR